MKLAPLFQIVITISTFFSISTSYGQVEIEQEKELLRFANSSDEEISQLVKITDYYNDKSNRNKDSLKLYNDLLLKRLDVGVINETLINAQTRNLIVRYNTPFKEYEILARSLIKNLSALGLFEKEINERYYLALKAHNSGEVSSLDFYKESLEILRVYKAKVSDSFYCRWVSKFRAGIASNYEYLGMNERALEEVTIAIDEAEECGDTTGLLFVYKSASGIVGNISDDMGLIQGNHKDIEKTLVHFLEKTNSLAATRKDDFGSQALANYNLAFYYFKKDQYSSAIEYAFKSIEGEQIKWMPMQRYFSNLLLSNIHLKLEDQEKSFHYLQKSGAAAKEMKDERHDFLSSLDLATWYKKTEDYAKSYDLLLKMKDKVEGKKEFERQYLEERYQVAEALNLWQDAHDSYKNFTLISNELESESTTDRLAYLISENRNIQTQNDLAQLEKEHLNQSIQLRNITILALFGILLLFGILGLLYFRYKRSISLKEKEQRNIEDRLFRSQMNPHFIFNTLGSIQSFLLEKNKSKEAAYFMAKFAKLMRQILVQSQEGYIPFHEEIETLQNYLLLQQMRFENKFDWSININDESNTEGLYIPPLLLQPIVENAIEHGKVYTKDQGKIDIKFSKQKDLITVDIIDNGVGWSENEISFSDDRPRALTIIKKRLNHLSDQVGISLQLIVKPNLPTGTHIALSLPFE